MIMPRVHNAQNLSLTLGCFTGQDDLKGKYLFCIDFGVAQRLARISMSNGCSLFTSSLTLCAIVENQVTCQQDLLVGVRTPGSKNILPLPINISANDTFKDLSINITQTLISLRGYRWNRHSYKQDVKAFGLDYSCNDISSDWCSFLFFKKALFKAEKWEQLSWTLAIRNYRDIETGDLIFEVLYSNKFYNENIIKKLAKLIIIAFDEAIYHGSEKLLEWKLV